MDQNRVMAPNALPTGEPTVAPAPGQRRYVTVLFADVSDSSEHAERLEAEAYALLLEQFRAFAREVIPRHGGSIARLQGDGVLALFGHLQTREDDGRRAAEAALELHAAVARLRAGTGAAATVLQLHSGIHAGLVLLIDGDIERGRFDVVGEVPNTAARLCSLAASGQILVSEETLGPQVHFFQVTLPRRTKIRGRAAALNVLCIEGRATVTRRIDAAARRGVVPFVGRQAALGRLFAAADRALKGETGLVLINGEPGIGKTRLVDEFERRLDTEKFLVIRGSCESYLAAEPLQPFLQALRGACGWSTGVAASDDEAARTDALAAVLADESMASAAEGPSGGAAAELSAELATTRALLESRSDTPGAPSAARRSQTLIRLLTLLAQQRALVLALDDWQWADDASRQVLDAMRGQDLPLLVLLVQRSDADDDIALRDERAQLLRLDALEPAEAESAIAAWLPGTDPWVAQDIYRQSGGSPLFIEELCHASAAGDAVPAAPGGRGVAWINALVASRLARLPDDEAECLQLAAVSGSSFTVELLQHLHGAGDVAPLLGALATHDFLVAAGPGHSPGTLRFKHALARDAVYATVEPMRRRALHLRVAQSLEGGGETSDSLEALAYHCDAAGLGDKTAQYAEAAGDKALEAMALDRARAHYLTALRALDTLPALPRPLKLRWCGIARKLGQSCVFDPLDIAHGLELFDRAAQMARATGDDNALARAEYWLGYTNYSSGRPARAVRHCEAALVHALASDDPRLAAQVRATLGQALASAGHYGRALPLMREAVESKRQQARPGSAAAVGSAYTLARTAYTLGDLGRFAEAHAVFDEAFALVRGQPHAVASSVHELVCAVHLWQGRWEDARTSALAGETFAQRCRSRYLIAMGRALGACSAYAQGGGTDALQSLREATRWIDARGGAVSTSLLYGWLVEACVGEGLPQEARQQAARLFGRARLQDRHGQAMGCRALARLAAAQGAMDRAWRCLKLADAAAEARGSPRERAENLLAQAELAAVCGRAPAARALIEEASEAFKTMAMAAHLAQASALARRL